MSERLYTRLYTQAEVMMAVEVAAGAAADKALELTQEKVLELVLQRDEARRGRAAAWDVGYAAAILDMGQSDEPPSINPWHEEAIA